MFKSRQAEEGKNVAKYRITLIQTVLAIIALLSVLLLGLSSIYESRTAEDRSQLLTDVESPAASIIFTQRETLVYATRLALWSNGGTPRRNVPIARNLLAQRPAVVASSDRSMGTRASSAYWSALQASDSIVSASPAGVLPENLHSAVNKDLIPVIDQLLAQARKLVVSYQRTVDQEMVALAEETARRDSLNLLLLYTFISSGALSLALYLRSNFKRFQKVRAEIEREQKELEKTVEKLLEAQNRVAQLEDLDSAKDALISTVNHELRTPLTSIIGYVELMRRGGYSESEMNLYLEVLERNSQILLSLVESMLSLSKFDNAVGKLPNESVNLSEVIENVLFALKPATTSGQIEISFTSEEELQVRGDASQLSQVFINLITNAIKFSGPGSKVNIQLRRGTNDDGRETAVISIEDHGIGIPQDDIPRIFTRFFRAKNVGSSNYHGTGLGLAIVEKVVAHHDGSIAVHSLIGKGTVFELQLPLFTEGSNNG